MTKKYVTATPKVASYTGNRELDFIGRFTAVDDNGASPAGFTDLYHDALDDDIMVAAWAGYGIAEAAAGPTDYDYVFVKNGDVSEITFKYYAAAAGAWRNMTVPKGGIVLMPNVDGSTPGPPSLLKAGVTIYVFRNLSAT